MSFFTYTPATEALEANVKGSFLPMQPQHGTLLRGDCGFSPASSGAASGPVSAPAMSSSPDGRK